MSDVTCLLDAIQHGDPLAADELLPLVYAELRRLAHARMAREQPGQTLQPTALVHEAWLRLVGDKAPMFANRAHFFWRGGGGHATDFGGVRSAEEAGKTRRWVGAGGCRGGRFAVADAGR
jgi:hypothetical protein